MTVVTKFGKVVLHKAKRNNNLSFSKGKTWQLEDTRGLEVVGVSPLPSASVDAGGAGVDLEAFFSLPTLLSP